MISGLSFMYLVCSYLPGIPLAISIYIRFNKEVQEIFRGNTDVVSNIGNIESLLYFLVLPLILGLTIDWTRHTLLWLVISNISFRNRTLLYLVGMFSGFILWVSFLGFTIEPQCLCIALFILFLFWGCCCFTRIGWYFLQNKWLENRPKYKSPFWPLLQKANLQDLTVLQRPYTAVLQRSYTKEALDMILSKLNVRHQLFEFFANSCVSLIFSFPLLYRSYVKYNTNLTQKTWWAALIINGVSIIVSAFLAWASIKMHNDIEDQYLL